MLYVDGMNGVMEQNQTIQWLYSLISSKFRLVVKTALKLLLVFVEYVETNSVLLVKAIETVDVCQGKIALTQHNTICSEFSVFIIPTTLVWCQQSILVICYCCAIAFSLDNRHG